MKPHFLRAIFAILVLRAIVVSSAQGSEFGPSWVPDNLTLKRLDAVPSIELRLTKPCTPLVAKERIDCLDGGDDDERTSLSKALANARFWVILPYVHLPHRPTIARAPRSFIRLRC
jgi:hypothetical protein